MTIEIDQSGRVEYTSHDTVIAFSNGQSKAIKVTARTKRQLQEYFRRRGKTRLFVYRVFAALIFLLIKDNINKIGQIYIDEEYQGQEKLIREILLEFIRKEKLKEPEIDFKRIGNHPKVHYAAYDVFVGKKKADKIVSFREIADLAIKKDRGQKD